MGLFGASKGSAEHDPDTALDVPLTESAHEGGPHSPGHQHEHQQEQEQGRVAVPVSRSGGKFHYEPQEAGAHKGRDEGEDEDLEELDLDTEKALHIEPGEGPCPAGAPHCLPSLHSHGASGVGSGRDRDEDWGEVDSKHTLRKCRVCNASPTRIHA